MEKLSDQGSPGIKHHKLYQDYRKTCFHNTLKSLISFAVRLNPALNLAQNVICTASSTEALEAIFFF